MADDDLLSHLRRNVGLRQSPVRPRSGERFVDEEAIRLDERQKIARQLRERADRISETVNTMHNGSMRRERIAAAQALRDAALNLGKGE